VESYDAPVLNLRPAPYKNGVIIRELNRKGNKNDLLNQIVTNLQLHEQNNNLFGVFFIDELNDNTDYLSVVLLLRNVKTLFKVLKEHYKCQDDLCFIRIDGVLKEVLDLNKANYKLMFSANDTRFTCKLLSFDNTRMLVINQAWNIFDKLISEKPNEILSIITTKKKVFLLCSTENGQTDILRQLLLKFGTDYNLTEANENLVFVRKSSQADSSFKFVNDITVHFNRV
jgi:hypothetical protein